MRCFRRLLGISYRDHVTNEKVGNRIRQAIGPYDDLTTVKKRKLRWYGHKTRSTGLAKMILQGTVQGGRRRGRQKKRWEDNVTEWTGLKLREALRKAENREEWRTVVARSSLVPQRSNRLWDKWQWSIQTCTLVILTSLTRCATFVVLPVRHDAPLSWFCRSATMRHFRGSTRPTASFVNAIYERALWPIRVFVVILPLLLSFS